MTNDKKQNRLTSTRKLSLLITIVRKSKADYFIDELQAFHVNMQMVLIGNGTTKSALFSDEIGTKAIILSLITEENIPKALKMLEEKFHELRDGKGVAWTTPLDSVMGVTFFNFLSNNKSSII